MRIFLTTNHALMTAAMDELPLGDLYHWWPAQYTTWQAQAATEHTFITNWLTTGTPTDVRQESAPRFRRYFELDQNYPNPFNPTTTINYSVPKTGNMTLKVYNLLGQEVATLFAGVQQSGNHTAVFDGSKLASGVYFYRLEAGKQFHHQEISSHEVRLLNEGSACPGFSARTGNIC